MPDEKLPKSLRLGGKRISEIFDTGGAGKGRFFIVRALPSGRAESRFSPIAGRKSGKANVRNRIKRLVRDIFRRNKAQLPAGYDLLFIARAGVLEQTRETLCKDIVRACGNAVRCAPTLVATPECAPTASPRPASGTTSSEPETTDSGVICAPASDTE